MRNPKYCINKETTQGQAVGRRGQSLQIWEEDLEEGGRGGKEGEVRTELW